MHDSIASAEINLALAEEADDQNRYPNLEDVLDELIQIKQPRNQNITHADRIEQLEKYKVLERLKTHYKGRILFEYEDGLETYTKEVII